MKILNFMAACIGMVVLAGCDCGSCGNGAAAVADDAPTEVAVVKPIRLNVFYTVKDEASRAEAVATARKLVEASRQDAGCISYDFLESATQPGEYMIIETWENDSVLDIHSNAPHFTEYVPVLRQLGEMRAERFLLGD